MRIIRERRTIRGRRGQREEDHLGEMRTITGR